MSSTEVNDKNLKIQLHIARAVPKVAADRTNEISKVV
jgi:hypothetical protein